MIIPPERPKQSLAETLEILDACGVDLLQDPVALLFVRGYYMRTLGHPTRNDRGLYDDAAFLATTGWGQRHYTWNANADPSIYRPGKGFGAGKGIARLKDGVYRYQLGIHGLSRPPQQRYEALVQAAPVTVIRDGSPDYEDTGWFGINIHRGGATSTSSAGCLTIPSGQWSEFISVVKRLLNERKLRTILVALVTHPDYA